jgi:hypothetical protein
MSVLDFGKIPEFYPDFDIRPNMFNIPALYFYKNKEDNNPFIVFSINEEEKFQETIYRIEQILLHLKEAN